jgi:hypothetical protein
MQNIGVTRALKRYRALVEHEYGMSLEELLAADNPAIRNRRLWRLTGVVLKQRYAKPELRRPTPKVKARYRYDINRTKLQKRLAGRTWEAKLLAQLPGRKPRESVSAYVLRLKTETKHGNKVRDYVCRFVCADDGTLNRTLLRLHVDPKEVGALVLRVPTIVVLMDAGTKLMPDFPHKEALMGIAMMIALGVEGMESLCIRWRSERTAATEG